MKLKKIIHLKKNVCSLNGKKLLKNIDIIKAEIVMEKLFVLFVMNVVRIIKDFMN